MDNMALDVRLKQARPIPLDVSFSCGAGEVLALVGPSGSGKSTILRCIAGLNKPDEGVVNCNGVSWLDTMKGLNLKPQDRSVGVLFQNYALFPHMSAIDNVISALGHVDKQEHVGRASQLLELVHLQGLERRHPGNLSGGQQQRVALARALARDPATLLLDEPFSSVDKVTRGKLYRELALLRKRLETPVVMVTHDLEEATILADRLCILYRGESLQTGAPLEILSHPRNVLVARLVGLRNIFNGRVIKRQDDGSGVIEWRDRVLDVADCGTFSSGDPVSWVLPPAGIILHRNDRPSNGEKENPVEGKVMELMALGETVNVILALDQMESAKLSFNIPSHVAKRHQVVVGSSFTVTLSRDDIHLMACESDVEGKGDT